MGEFLDFSYEDFRYKLYVPHHYKAGKDTPLLVMLHGCDQNPDDFAAGTNMNILAEQENFLVLYPDMNHLFNPSNPASYNPYGCWNWFLDKNQHRGMGHPRLINAMIEQVKGSYSIDANRVYAAGISAGASLACILGVTYPDVFNGIGIFAGLPYGAANVFFLTDPMAEAAKKSMQKGVPDPYACGNNAFLEMGALKKKMPIIVFHGLCDTVVHPINGKQVIIQWAQTNFLAEGGTGNAEVNPDLVKADIINGRSCTQHVYCDKSGEPLMELWLVDQLGHAWSGGSQEGSYTDPLGPNASEIIWDFFVKKKRKQEDSLDETPIGAPMQAPIETLSEAPIATSVPVTSETLSDLPGKFHDQASSERLSETARENQTEELHQTPEIPAVEPEKTPVKVHKRNFIRNLIWKLIKKRS